MTVRPFVRNSSPRSPPSCSRATPRAQQAALTKLEVFPPDINLSTSRDRQSFVVQATLRRRHHPRRHRRGQGHASANPALAKLDGNDLPPARRRRRPS